MSAKISPLFRTASLQSFSVNLGVGQAELAETINAKERENGE
ncbi:MAG: hypothetical protein QXM52_02230 [Candidatus Bathyarchaeia archaeon]